MTEAVNGESVRLTRLSRSLDTRPLRAFIIGGGVISVRDEAYILSLRSTWGVTTLRSFLVSSLGTGTFLVFFLVVVSCIPLAQLLFQIVVLLSEAFLGCGKGLYLSLKSRHAWFVSLNVVSGRH